MKARLALVACGLLLALVCAEVALRIQAQRENERAGQITEAGDLPVPENGRVALGHIIRVSANDDIIYELKPNLDGVPFKGEPLTTNARGFRGPQVPEAADGTRTIVAIGDSILFGHGVGDEAPYARVLERMLDPEGSGSWRVVNTGVPGYNSTQQVETLRAKCLELEPDLLLWSLVGNDLELPPYIRRDEDVWTLRKSYLLSWWRRRSHTAQVEFHPLLGRSPSAGERFEGDPERVPPRYKDHVGWDSFVRAADAVEALASEHGFRVFCFATYTDDVVDRMIEACAERGFETATLMDELLEYMERTGNDHYKFTELVVSPNNLHPSVLRHRMAATKIHSRLVELGWVENRP